MTNLAVVCLILAGCLPQVRIKTIDPLTDSKRLAVEVTLQGNQPSQATLQALRLNDLEDRWKKDGRVVLAILNQLHKIRQDPELLASLAELSLREAQRLRETRPRQAKRLSLVAATRAYLYLFDGQNLTLERAFDRRFQQIRDVYNIALGLYLQLHMSQHGGIQSHRQDTPYEEMVIRLNTEGPNAVDPEPFEELLPVLDLHVKGPRNYYYRDGIGTALVGYYENRGIELLDDYYPPEGIVRPLTAILSYQPSSPGEDEVVELTFYCPQQTDAVDLKNTEQVPLAADFTMPYGYLLSKARLKQLGRQGLVNAEKALFHFGLFMLEPYDPEQIPIVMVHGLGSSPIAWMELTNDLNGDPELRRRYQIWHFMYPTSVPYLFGGHLLRSALENVQQSLDPEGDDPAMQSMVFVAHSMGGLLTKTLISDSGETLRDAFYTSPLEDLSLHPVDRDLLEDLIYFEPLDFVDRVIFIATPHRGSQLASSTLGRIGSSLVRLPKEFIDFFDRVALENITHLQPRLAELSSSGKPTSIRALAPDDPGMLALAALTIDPKIPYHSIVGNRGKSGPISESTDGVVPYASSHLPGADSEFIVPSGHNAYNHPFAIAEIRRILKLHLEQLDAPTLPNVESPAALGHD